MTYRTYDEERCSSERMYAIPRCDRNPADQSRYKKKKKKRKTEHNHNLHNHLNSFAKSDITTSGSEGFTNPAPSKKKSPLFYMNPRKFRFTYPSIFVCEFVIEFSARGDFLPRRDQGDGDHDFMELGICRLNRSPRELVQCIAVDVLLGQWLHKNNSIGNIYRNQGLLIPIGNR